MIDVETTRLTCACDVKQDFPVPESFAANAHGWLLRPGGPVCPDCAKTTR